MKTKFYEENTVAIETMILYFEENDYSAFNKHRRAYVEVRRISINPDICSFDEAENELIEWALSNSNGRDWFCEWSTKRERPTHRMEYRPTNS